MSNYGDSASYPQGPNRAPETSPQRIAAARADARLYVATLADWVQAGFMPMADAETEVADLFQALATRFALTPDERQAAHDAEWSEANRAAIGRLNSLRKLIRQLAWDSAPMATILAATTAEADRLRANFGNEQLEALARVIVKPIVATIQRRERRS